MTQVETIVTGLRFPESPRWHDGRLWYLDLPAHALRAVDRNGRDLLVRTFDERPAAFDVLPGGPVVVALQDSLRIVRLDDDSTYADLSRLENEGQRFWKFGDMVVDGRGRLYIGGIVPRPDVELPLDQFRDAIILVEPGGRARLVADRCVSPNGVVVSPDGQHLVLAESLAARLTTWRIEDDGSLTERRLFADIPGQLPDGICCDLDGAIWVAGLSSGEAVRVGPDGFITDTVALGGDRLPIAVMLGGDDGRDLFIASCRPIDGRLASWSDCLTASGFIERAHVNAPSGGWPSSE